MANIDTASRLSTASGCARKFQFQYVDKIPQRDGGALILGNTIHDGLEAWFRMRREKGDQPEGTLWKLMQEAWWSHLPKPLARHMKPDLENALKLEAIAEALRITRGVVQPTGTKDYKATAEAQAAPNLADKVRRWLDANENVIRWNKSEPPTKTWMVARRVAAALEKEWAPRPVPWLVEDKFQVIHEGVEWRGRIDVYGPILPTGELEPILIDWKSGARPPSAMEFFIQATVYHIAMTERGMPVEEIQFRMVRLPVRDDVPDPNPVRIVIDPDRHYPMLNRMRSQIEHTFNELGVYIPSYSFSCRNCDYNAFCERELGIIKGGSSFAGDSADEGE